MHSQNYGLVKQLKITYGVHGLLYVAYYVAGL